MSSPAPVRGTTVASCQLAVLLVLGLVWGGAVLAFDSDLGLAVTLAVIVLSPAVLAVSYVVALRRFWHAAAGPTAPTWVRFVAGVAQGLTILALFATAVLALVVAHAVATWPADA